MIYAVQPTAGGPVKIGHSADVPARIRQLEAHYGRPLALLATLPGGPKEERAVHRQFAHLRLGRTEQFRPAADLMAFLSRPLLVGANPNAVEAMPDLTSRPIQLDPDLAVMAEYLAAFSGKRINALINELLRPVMEREFARQTSP